MLTERIRARWALRLFAVLAVALTLPIAVLLLSDNSDEENAGRPPTLSEAMGTRLDSEELLPLTKLSANRVRHLNISSSAPQEKHNNMDRSAAQPTRRAIVAAHPRDEHLRNTVEDLMMRFPLPRGGIWTRLLASSALVVPPLRTHATAAGSHGRSDEDLRSEALCLFDLVRASNPCDVDRVCRHRLSKHHADLSLQRCIASCAALEIVKLAAYNNSIRRDSLRTVCDVRDTLVRSSEAVSQPQQTEDTVVRRVSAFRRSAYSLYPVSRKCGRVHVLDLGVPESLFSLSRAASAGDGDAQRPWKPLDIVGFPLQWTELFKTRKDNVTMRDRLLRVVGLLQRSLFAYHDVWQDDAAFDTAPNLDPSEDVTPMEKTIPIDHVSLPPKLKDKLRLYLLLSEGGRVPQHALDLRLPIVFAAGALPVYRDRGQPLVPFFRKCIRCLPSVDGTLMLKIIGTKGLASSTTGTSVIWKEFDMGQYWLLRDEVRQYARRRMTTAASAAYILKISLPTAGRAVVYLSPSTETCGVAAHATIHGLLDLGVRVSIVKPEDASCAPHPVVVGLYGFDLSDEAQCEPLGITFTTQPPTLYDAAQSPVLHLFFAASYRDFERQASALDALQRYSEFTGRGGRSKKASASQPVIATALLYSGRLPLDSSNRVCDEVMKQLARPGALQPAVFTIRSTRLATSTFRWSLQLDWKHRDEAAAADKSTNHSIGLLSDLLASEAIAATNLPKGCAWQPPMPGVRGYVLCRVTQLNDAAALNGFARHFSSVWTRAQKMLGQGKAHAKPERMKS